MALTDAQFKAWLATTDKIITALVEVVARISGVETTLYLSNRNFTTGAAETPASIAYNACICGGLQFTEELGLDGSPLVSYGDIELSNPDGRLDGYLDYVWKNRACSIYIGDPRWPRADFRKAYADRQQQNWLKIKQDLDAQQVDWAEFSTHESVEKPLTRFFQQKKRRRVRRGRA